VSGSFEGTTLIQTKEVCSLSSCVEVPSIQVKSDGLSDVYAAMYDRLGDLRWFLQIGGKGVDLGGGLAVDMVLRAPFGRMGRYDNRQSHSTFKDSNNAFKLQAKLIDYPMIQESRVYIAGTSEGEARFKVGLDKEETWTIKALCPRCTFSWLVAINASTGYIDYARKMADCTESRQEDDRRYGAESSSQHGLLGGEQTYKGYSIPGECSVSSLSLDGNGNIVVLKSWIGDLTLPKTVSFHFTGNRGSWIGDGLSLSLFNSYSSRHHPHFLKTQFSRSS